MMRFVFLPAIFVAVGMTAACTARTSYVDLYGQPAPASAADRTIAIKPATKYVNVEGGQTINFVVGDKQFAWTFNVARTVDSFDLNDVAPAGVLDHVVRAYVTPDPKYINAPSDTVR